MGKILKRPTFLAVPEFVLKTMLRDEASLIMDSQRITPENALRTGFRFHFPDLPSALTDILGTVENAENARNARERRKR